MTRVGGLLGICTAAVKDWGFPDYSCVFTNPTTAEKQHMEEAASVIPGHITLISKVVEMG